MPTGTIIVLGAFAGLTIYLGLPLACFKRVHPSLRMFLSMFATGILVFLLYDVISKASEPIGTALDEMRLGHGSGPGFFADLLLLIAGLAIGLIGLVYFNGFVIARSRRSRRGVPAPGGGASAAVASNPPVLALVGAGLATPSRDHGPIAADAAVTPAAPAVTPVRDLSARTLALIIAIGIGLHNFSEGLAIGQSAALGELQLAAVLIIGFGLHNMTEGFGIAGPLTSQTSWKFVALLGLIGGGPTFLGTVAGIAFHSPQLFIFCLALAAGAIIYVVAELLGVSRRFHSQQIVMWGLLAGFLLGYLTDLIVTFAGA